MKLYFKRIFAAALLILGVNGANAATYGVTEMLSGTWSNTGPNQYSYTYGTETFISGDSSLLSQTTTASAIFSPGTFNCITCTFTSALSGGNSIFGTFSVLGSALTPTNPTNLIFGDLFAITGGTGLFADATGNGIGFGTHFGALLNGSPQTTGISSQYVTLNVTTPVPEPETYAMMLAGLGVLSLVARRKQSV